MMACVSIPNLGQLSGTASRNSFATRPSIPSSGTSCSVRHREQWRREGMSMPAVSRLSAASSSAILPSSWPQSCFSAGARCLPRRGPAHSGSAPGGRGDARWRRAIRRSAIWHRDLILAIRSRSAAAKYFRINHGGHHNGHPGRLRHRIDRR